MTGIELEPVWRLVGEMRDSLRRVRAERDEARAEVARLRGLLDERSNRAHPERWDDGDR